ncbi:hypothetical protein E3N88_37521 [Mikania micrantha]|uniref:Uncharacterized protein n=1 Tax=Mikania micrantha TaxID=192012 RepID=A0A5N6LRC8_9ASTR|nr:hypothetical protein E3N88_37521 [Mikania micrantha]
MHGLKTLQEEILSNVLKSEVTFTNLEQGTYMMETRLCQNSVLIVLDDVHHTDHLKMLAGSPNWFGKGSRVIFTTRNRYLLNYRNVLTHNVRMLDDTEAIEVFCWHAFGKREPLQGFEKDSLYIVSKCGGHPSALKNLGSFLNGKRESVFLRILDRLKGNNPALFWLKIHHGEIFTNFTYSTYVEGQVRYVDLMDQDELLVHEINAIMKELAVKHLQVHLQELCDASNGFSRYFLSPCAIKKKGMWCYEE